MGSSLNAAAGAAARVADAGDRSFERIADAIGAAYLLLAPDLRAVLGVTAGYERIWARSCDALLASPHDLFDGVASDDRSTVREALATVASGAPATVAFRVIQPGGDTRHVRMHGVPVPGDGGVVDAIRCLVFDVTESVSLQHALDESESRFRKLTDATFDAICVAQDGVLREVNRGFVDMFGYASVAEVVGRPPADFVAEESKEVVQRAIVAGFEGVYNVIGLRKDGGQIILEVTARVHTANGRAARITALRNITQHRALEDQFRHAQKMEAVGRLAGGVAHDFNNLLTVINSYTQILADDMDSGDPRRAELAEIEKAAAGAATLTRQLLAFSRQEVIQPRRLALQEVVSSASKILLRLIGEDIRLETVLSSTPLNVEIDPGQFEQVIMNLAVNSRDAMPKGGKLTIETAVAEFDDAYVRTHWPAIPGRYAMLAVSDTGVGMTEAVRARIFEPFFTTKERGKGTGLGLATVYGIVKNAGGFIWVYSEPGQGTAFKVYLPLVDTDSDVIDASALPAPAPRGVETILLVEDSPAVRGAVLKTLERLGYRVLEAPSGKDALRIAVQENGPIHAVITDVVMPELSGRELADKLATIRPETKVLFMSGYTDDAVVRHGLVQPGVSFLQKPFSVDALATKLREMLDG